MPSATVTLPADSISRVARLLTDLDEFLRSAPTLPDQLTCFLHERGDDHPRFTANNLVDEVAFTAAWLKGQAAADRILETACDQPEPAAQALRTDGHRPPRRSGS